MANKDWVHLSVTIQRSPGEVYAYISSPQHLPEWAAGLSGSIQQRHGIWWAHSPMGEVQVRFVDPNPFRVADHTVTLPDGQRVLNPMRVLEHPLGSEVVFSLLRRPEMSPQDFQRDQQAVKKDLATLKQVLEGG